MKREITDSYFNMWRCLMALAHADGQVTDSEAKHVTQAMEKLPFDDSQRSTLLADLESPRNAIELFELITEPVDRGQLIYLSRLLFWSDGDFAAQEKVLHDKLTEKVMGQIDLKKIMGQANSAADQALKDQKNKGLRGLIDKLVESFGI